MLFAPRRIISSDFRRALGRAVLVTGLLAGLQALPAMADDLADVSQLLRVGRHAQALLKADAYLSRNPRDPQMHFLKGVIFTEQNKPNEAIEIFTKLTKDYPSLPEPYNNLAVLYAAAGRYDDARLALDKAIHTNPTYATAYENLGDVHAKLASQAYDKALQLDHNNAGAKSKLTMIRTLVGNMTGGTNSQVAVVAAAPAKPEPKPEVKPETPKPEPKPESKPEPQPDPKAAQKRQEAEAKREAKAKADAERAEVRAAVSSWAKAWSARDVKGYLNAYANDFALPAGQSRKDWATERRARIEGKKHISVKIESLQVSMNGNTATVKFRQIYDSDRFNADSRKVLVLVKQGGKWQIKQERSGS